MRKPPVGGPVGGQAEDFRRSVGEEQPRAGQEAQACALGGEMATYHPGKAVAISQRDRVMAERPGRQEGSAEKVEYDLVIEQCLRGKGRDTNVIVPRAAAVRGLAGSARGQRATARNSVDEVEQLRQEMQRMQCAMRAREDEMDRREAEHRAEVARLEAELKLPMWGLHRMTDKKSTHALTPFPGPKSLRAFIDLLEVDGFLQATRLSANTDYNCRVRHYNGLGSTGGKVHRRTKAPRSSAGGAASAASDDSDGGDTYFGQSDIY